MFDQDYVKYLQAPIHILLSLHSLIVEEDLYLAIARDVPGHVIQGSYSYTSVIHTSLL